MTAPCPALGFIVTMEPTTAWNSDEADALLEDWIDFLESLGLHCSGGGADLVEYVVASDASQATENDRVAANAWLSSRSELSRWRVGDLHDLNHDV